MWRHMLATIDSLSITIKASKRNPYCDFIYNYTLHNTLYYMYCYIIDGVNQQYDVYNSDIII